MIDATGVAGIDEPRVGKAPESGGLSWGQLGGMLMLMAGTVGFWLLVFRYAKREKRTQG
jgi:hypothetical protein